MLGVSSAERAEVETSLNRSDTEKLGGKVEA